MLGRIVDKILLNESVSSDKVIKALKDKKVIIVSYLTEGKKIATKNRHIEVYAYGLTSKGNEVIRCFQREGDTTTKVPHWKFMRLDRIIYWKETDETFETPPNERYKGVANYNDSGDKTMSVVFLKSNIKGG